MSPVFKKNLVATLIVIGSFLVISLLYNYPVLQGKVLASHDNIFWKGVSQEANQYSANHSEEVLWSNSMFGGMPTYTFWAPTANNYTKYIGNFIIDGFLPKPANFFFLAMLSFFILASVLKMNRWLGFIGAIAFAFATYNCQIISAGHETKMMDIGYMPAVLAGFLLLARGKYLSGAVLFGISFSVMLTAGHYQIVWYLLIIHLFVAVGLIINAVKNGNVKQVLLGMLIALALGGIGVGNNMGVILPTAEYSKQTQRGGASELEKEANKPSSGGLDRTYAFRWSNGIGETFVMMVPYLYGGGSMEKSDKLPATNEATGDRAPALPSYWGPQADAGIAGPVYLGAVVCFLFVLGMMLIRNKVKWWMLGAIILSILMSFGKHLPGFNNFLFDHLPGYNKFRIPNMILVIPQFLFPLIGVWGLHEVLTGTVTKEELWKKTKIAVIATAGLCLVLGLGSSLFLDFTNPATDESYKDILSFLKEDRAAMARNSGIVSALFIVLTGGVLWLYYKGTATAQMMIIGVGLLIAIDLMPTGYRYLNEDKYEDKDEYAARFAPRRVDQAILDQEKDPYYRVLDVSRDLFGDGMQCYHFKSVGGYSAAKLLNYQDLINEQMGRGLNSEVMNMLNVKYFITPGQGEGQEQPIPNPNACGNAWFVNELKFVKTATEEMRALDAPSLGDTAQNAGGFRAKQTGIFRAPYQQKLQGITPVADPTASIKLTKYGLNDLTFQSTNTREGVGMFSDIYFDKGWKAYIDGKETEILRANYVLRALRIPAGNHKIEFKFLPQSYVTGKTIALITTLILLAIVVMWIISLVKQNKAEISGKA